VELVDISLQMFGIEMVRLLTPQQIIFCNSFLKSSNGASAARDANYSESSARQAAAKLLKKPQVQKYLRGHQFSANMRTEICVDQLVEDTQFLQKRATEKLDFKTAISSIDLIAKLLGFYDPKLRYQIDLAKSQNSSGKKGYKYELERLTFEERNMLIRLLAKSRVIDEQEM